MDESAAVPVSRVAAVVAGFHRAATSRACPRVAAWSTKLVSSQVRDNRRLWASEWASRVDAFLTQGFLS